MSECSAVSIPNVDFCVATHLVLKEGLELEEGGVFERINPVDHHHGRLARRELRHHLLLDRTHIHLGVALDHERRRGALVQRVRELERERALRFGGAAAREVQGFGVLAVREIDE